MDMESISEMEIKNFLGKKAKDIYGRYLGPVVSILKNNDDELEYIQVDFNEGRLVKYAAEQIMTDKDEIIIMPTWRIEVEKIKKEIGQMNKRMNALREMIEKEEISKEIYEGLKLSQSSSLKELLEKHDKSITSLKDRLKELDIQINELSSFLVEMRTGKTAGKIQDDEYEKALKSIEQNLNYLFLEKKDIEELLIDLEKIRNLP